MTEESPEQQTTVEFADGWRWNNQAPPPISGQVRTDSRDWTGAKKVSISNTTDAGLDVSATLQRIAVGSNLDLVHRTDPSRSVRYQVLSLPVDRGSYTDVPVTFVIAAGMIPTSNTPVNLVAQVDNGPSILIGWSIDVAREPNRWWVTCSCVHSQIAELTATNPFGAPSARLVVETTALNLRRATGCNCTQLSPGLP